MNNVSSGKAGGAALSCAELAGHRLSRREGLGLFLEELEGLRGAGAGELRDLWNSRAEGIGGRVTMIPAEHGEARERAGGRGRGIFSGIDRQGRCRITGARNRSYAPGTVSLLYHEI
ncbi:MAG: hypothetical protein LBF95_00425 [Treponema sp.]|nr:hypothetical protein [Treponema sp.]